MKLNQFRYLSAIAEYGSIARAARALYISQPSVSQAVRELEEELGFPVLVRTRQGASFTPKGIQVLEIAQAVIRELNKLDKLAGGSGAELWGNLAVGGTSYFSDSLLLNAIVTLHMRHPNLIIRLEENDSRAILGLLRDGAINLGVILHCNLDEIQFKSKIKEYGLSATPLFEDEMVFVAGEDHPLAQLGAAPMKTILEYPVIQYKSAINDQTLHLFRQYRSDPELLYINDFNSLWRLPLIGPYLFLSPSLSLRSHGQPKLRPVRILDLNYHCTVSWVHNAQPLSAAETAVVSTLGELSARLTSDPSFNR